VLRLGALVLVALLAVPVHARLEKNARGPVEAVSADGAFRFTVAPTPAGQTARLERSAAAVGWETVWETSVPFTPSHALVSDDGRYVATFGWAYGPEAVAVYGPDGRIIHALSLLDFLTEDEILRLPLPAWGRGHRFDGDRLVLRAVLAAPGLPPRAWPSVGVSIHLPEVRVLRGDGSLEAIGAQLERCDGYRRAENRMRACRAGGADVEWCRICL
jgi:hypothetical protein